ncbi:integrase catalytic domain-containing protein [Trichonephila inaurata madagascariensis]|uniref:Integrase catalytic domain-containing protein n=1 Tax=Trichonephila inaurata madagascariensis TaxID=2747483 RepID=A0A8X6YG77_9ARAC|nr:integrase catalytic domain-containing protein [Trichonephila inaurata madagascariensis]
MNRKIDELKDQYYDIKDISESELEVIEADIQSMEDRLEVRIRDILNSLIAKSSVSSVHNHENAISEANSKLKLEIKLPEIPLPVFRGRYDEWPSFKSQFDNVITNNNDLNESQKLYYLKASLQGDVKLLEAVDDSFESLITALKTRFENKRLLTETHINAVLEIEKLSESARDIRSMTDILNKNIRALKLLGFEREITLRVKQKVNIVIQNKNGDFSTALELLIVPFITTTSVHRMDATKKLWVLKLEWDEPLSNPTAKEWNDFVSTLPVIQNIHVPRLVIGKGRIIIHGLADASTAAYGAVLYAQSISEEDVSTRLLCSKSRVAPVKPITIPRLELCACVLLSQLLEKVLHSLTLPIQQIMLWTDSNIVLAWIQ